MKKNLFICFICAISMAAQAQQTAVPKTDSVLVKKTQDSMMPRVDNDKRRQTTSFAIYTDEDLNPILLFSPGNDQNYTMGIGFAFSAKSLGQSFLFRPVSWISKKLTGKAEFYGDVVRPEQNISATLSLNGTAFTPLDLRAKDIIQDDRPYAFLLGLSTKRYAFGVGQRPKFFTTEIVYAMLGLDLGRSVQSAIHRSMNDGNTKDPYIPEGWDNQISKGGEPTFLYSFTQENLLTDANVNNQVARSFYEVKYGYQGFVGYYTGGNIQISTRIGLLDSKNWIKNLNLLGNANKGIPGNSNSYLHRKFELYAFGSLRPTLMLYNELLQGGFRNTAYRMRFSQVNHFLLEWNTGIGMTIPWDVFTTNISWAFHAGRTSEFDTIYRRAHKWGTVQITFNW